MNCPKVRIVIVVLTLHWSDHVTCQQIRMKNNLWIFFICIPIVCHPKCVIPNSSHFHHFPYPKGKQIDYQRWPYLWVAIYELPRGPNSNSGSHTEVIMSRVNKFTRKTISREHTKTSTVQLSPRSLLTTVLSNLQKS